MKNMILSLTLTLIASASFAQDVTVKVFEKNTATCAEMANSSKSTGQTQDILGVAFNVLKFNEGISCYVPKVASESNWPAQCICKGEAVISAR